LTFFHIIFFRKEIPNPKSRLPQKRKEENEKEEKKKKKKNNEKKKRKNYIHYL